MRAQWVRFDRALVGCSLFLRRRLVAVERLGYASRENTYFETFFLFKGTKMTRTLKKEMAKTIEEENRN